MCPRAPHCSFSPSRSSPFLLCHPRSRFSPSCLPTLHGESPGWLRLLPRPWSAVSSLTALLRSSGFQFHLHAPSLRSTYPRLCTAFPKVLHRGPPWAVYAHWPPCPGTLTAGRLVWPKSPPLRPAQLSLPLLRRYPAPSSWPLPLVPQGLASEGALFPLLRVMPWAWSLFVYSWVAGHSCGAAGSH